MVGQRLVGMQRDGVDQWGHAQTAQRDLTVAYVQATIDPAYADLGRETPTQRQTVLRTVRLLRTVALQNDQVACVQQNVYALIMLHGAVKEEVIQRLSRLIALGMMQREQGQHHLPMRFRIAAGSSSGYSGPWQALDSELRAMLALDIGWGTRNIRYVNQRIEYDWDSVDLSQIWDKAVDAQTSSRLAANNSPVAVGSSQLMPN